MTKLDYESGKQPHVGTAMTRREIAMLACKILALWLFSQLAIIFAGLLLAVIGLVAEIVSPTSAGGDVSHSLIGVAAMAVPALGLLLAGLYLWFRAATLARVMVSDDPTPVMRPDVTKADIMSVAFSAVGVFLLVPVVRSLAGTFIRIAQDTYSFSEWWASPSWQADFWSSIIGLALALWLILGSRGIVRVVLWARSAGTSLGREAGSS